MAYLADRFPVNVAPGPIGGPSFSTDIATLIGGDEQRNQNWSESRHSYEASQGIKNDAQFAAIGSHFRMARGRAHHFRFKDWGDFTIARADGILSMVGVNAFQIYKKYGSVAGFEEFRKITRPVAGSLSVWDAGVLRVIGTHYTLDPETGIVTFVLPPAGSPNGSLLECAGQFDVPCRYDTDKLQATLVRYSSNGQSLHAWTAVPIVEHRE